MALRPITVLRVEGPPYEDTIVGGGGGRPDHRVAAFHVPLLIPASEAVCAFRGVLVACLQLVLLVAAIAP